MNMGSDRRSKYLPDTLAEKYREAVNDPELLALREDLGLIEIRISQLLAKIETDDPRVKWVEFEGLISLAETSILDGDVAAASGSIIKLKDLAQKKLEDYAVWDEITKMIENRRRVTESESNRLVRMQQMINAEDAKALFDKLLDAVKRHVKDPQIYAAIAYEFAVTTGAAHNGHLDTGNEEVQSGQSGRMDQRELLGSGTQGTDPTG